MGKCSQTQKIFFKLVFGGGVFVEILIGQGQALAYRTAVRPDPTACQCLIGTWATPQRE